MTLKELKEKLKKALLEARAIAAKAEEGERDFTAEERGQVEKYLEEARDLKEKIKKAEDDAAMVKEILDLGAGIEILDGKKKGGQPGVPAGKGLTIGEQFVKSEPWQAWLKSMGGNIPQKGVNSPPVEFKGLLHSVMRRKELIVGESDASAGAFVQTDYTGIYEPLGRYPRNVLELVQRRTTGSDLVHFVRQTRQVQEAAAVPEANVTEYSGASGEISGEKPEGTSRWEPVTMPVRTIAVWIPATTRALSDVGQLRGLIDQELRDDTQEELENQVLNGNGVGDNFTGILQTAGILHFAFDTDLLTTVRRARTYLAVTGRSRATAMVLHPNDSERFDLLTDNNGNFYFGGPVMGDTQRIWRVPVVESESITEGSALMGDWRKAILWDREQATIRVSDSHADFFIRNMVAILCELRAVLGVIRPSGFVVVDLESGT